MDDDGQEQQIFSWTHAPNGPNDLIPVRYLKMYHPKWPNEPSISEQSHIKLRNLRNPDKLSETCLNNIGSFKCVSQDYEQVAIGWGGHTTNGGIRPATFTVVMADGTTCPSGRNQDIGVGHDIPNHGGRYSPVIGVLGSWLWLCAGGHSTTSASCRNIFFALVIYFLIIIYFCVQEAGHECKKPQLVQWPQPPVQRAARGDVHDRGPPLHARGLPVRQQLLRLLQALPLQNSRDGL